MIREENFPKDKLSNEHPDKSVTTVTPPSARKEPQQPSLPRHESEKTRNGQSDVIPTKNRTCNAERTESCKEESMTEDACETKKPASEELEMQHRLRTQDSEAENRPPVSLTLKGLFKAVRTFSVRCTKPRPTLLISPQDNEVVVFQRPASPRANSYPRERSRSLPPVMNFDELHSSDGSVQENQDELIPLKVKKSTPHADMVTNLEIWDTLHDADSDLTGNITEKEKHLHTDFEFHVDALHEFGSPDSLKKHYTHGDEHSSTSLFKKDTCPSTKRHCDDPDTLQF